eukprot:14626705-Alexandrium_andersonii.AAC.1
MLARESFLGAKRRVQPLVRNRNHECDGQRHTAAKMAWPKVQAVQVHARGGGGCLLYTSPSPRD